MLKKFKLLVVICFVFSVSIIFSLNAFGVTASTAPQGANITVTNDLGAGTVVVSGLAAGDKITVYTSTDGTTAGTALGTATVGTGKTEAMFKTTKLSVSGGYLMVSVTSTGKSESEKTAKQYSAVEKSTKPLSANISVTSDWAATGTAGKIVVSALTEGDKVRVYQSTDGTTVGTMILGPTTVPATKTSLAFTTTKLLVDGGYIMISVQSKLKAESDNATINYSAVAKTTTPTLTGTGLSGKVTVTNNANPLKDIVSLTGLQAKDIVKVYKTSVSKENMLGMATVATGSTSAKIILAKDLGDSAEHVYITVKNPLKSESAALDYTYSAAPQNATLTGTTCSTTNAGISYTVIAGQATLLHVTETLGVLTVKGLCPLDTIKVYAADPGITSSTYTTMAKVLTTGKVKAGKHSLYLSPKLATSSGSIYVTVKSPAKYESIALKLDYESEPDYGVNDAPELMNGLSFIDAFSSTNNGKTVVLLGKPSKVGNTFVYMISSDTNAVPTPSVGYETTTGWTAVANGDMITAANGKHIGVAEIGADKKVVQFSDGIAVSINDVVTVTAIAEAGKITVAALGTITVGDATTVLEKAQALVSSGYTVSVKAADGTKISALGVASAAGAGTISFTVVKTGTPLDTADTATLNITVAMKTAMSVGDYVQFGNYYGAPILWRVVNVENDGTPLLLSEKVLCLKPFDAAEDGTHADWPTDRADGGSNKWENSNIREWLNSSSATVTYSTQPPVTAALQPVSTSRNAYASEAGFLSGFSVSERNLIKEVTRKSLLSDLDKAEKIGGTEELISNQNMATVVQNFDSVYYKNLLEKVYLLDVKELHDYLYARGYDHGKKPTAQAVANCQTTYNQISTTTYARYWSRSPGAGDNNDNGIRLIGSGENYSVIVSDAADGGQGIVPALNLTSGSFTSGQGTIADPYRK